MLVHLQDVLHVFLILLVAAAAVGVVLYLLVARQDRAAKAPARRQDTSRSTRRAPPPAAQDRTATPAAPATAAAPAELPPVDATVAAPADVPPVAATAQAREAQPEAVAAIPPAPALQPPPGMAAHLLLVDDSAVARTKLRRLFEGAGYTTALAKDGVEALQMLGRGRYALMITDLEMPEMDGIELIGVVAEDPATEDMPIIAITGRDDLQAKVHEYSGLFGIFSKPWNDRELLRRVDALVRLPRKAPATT